MISDSASGLGAPPSSTLPLAERLSTASARTWDRFLRLLPLNTEPSLLFVLVNSPILRRGLAQEATRILEEAGLPPVTVSFSVPVEQPLQLVFDAAAANPTGRYVFLFGLEESLNAPEYRHFALTDVNFHRDQVLKRLTCPLVVWTTEEALIDLATNAPDFVAWRSDLFTFQAAEVDPQAAYRATLLSQMSGSVTEAAPPGAGPPVDLERVYVLPRFVELRPRAADPPPDPETTPPPVASALDLTDLLGRERGLLVLGAVGTGKTTLLRYLALIFARQQAQIRLGIDEDLLPVLLSFPEVGRRMAHQGRTLLAVEGHAAPTHDLLALAVAPIEELAPGVANWLPVELEAGRCIVLADGIDEIDPPAMRDDLRRWLRDLVATYPDNRYVVTGRTFDGIGLLGPEPPVFGLMDLAANQIDELVARRYRELALLEYGDSPTALKIAALRAKSFLARLRTDPAVASLASNPLFLIMLASLGDTSDALPRRRVDLIDECIEQMLVHGRSGRPLGQDPGPALLSDPRRELERLAFWSQEHRHERLSREVVVAQVLASRLGTPARPPLEPSSLGDDSGGLADQVFGGVLRESGGILRAESGDDVAFANPALQQVLAARGLAREPVVLDRVQAHVHDPGWQEVLLNLGQVLSDERDFGSAAPGRARELIERIRTADSWLEAVLRRDVLFAARCVVDMQYEKLADLRAAGLDEVIALWRTTPYELQADGALDVMAFAAETGEEPRISAALLASLAEASTTPPLRALKAVAVLGPTLAAKSLADAVDLLRVGAPYPKSAYLQWALDFVRSRQGSGPSDEMRFKLGLRLGELMPAGSWRRRLTLVLTSDPRASLAALIDALDVGSGDWRDLAQPAAVRFLQDMAGLTMRHSSPVKRALREAARAWASGDIASGDGRLKVAVEILPRPTPRKALAGALRGSPDDQLILLARVEDRDVRYAAAWALGRRHTAVATANPRALEALARFWYRELGTTDDVELDGIVEPGRDIAYGELRRIAAQSAIRSDDPSWRLARLR